MTETEKARRAEASKFIEENTFPRNPRGCNSTVELLAAYGAAQYEAGAEWVISQLSDDLAADFREALPLREKEG